jgi:hypothetical protein
MRRLNSNLSQIANVAPPYTLTYISQNKVENTSTNPYTFASQAVGTAGYTKLIISYRPFASAGDITGITVGGNACTRFAQYSEYSAWYCNAAVGGNQNVVVTTDSTPNTLIVVIFNISSLSGGTYTPSKVTLNTTISGTSIRNKLPGSGIASTYGVNDRSMAGSYGRLTRVSSQYSTYDGTYFQVATAIRSVPGEQYTSSGAYDYWLNIG